jgi:metal-responsive CopG/Arc/MetJ family transcriptional regulator
MNKVRLSVSVNKELVDWLDARVKRDDLRSRSHAAERALREAMELDRKKGRES